MRLGSREAMAVYKAEARGWMMWLPVTLEIGFTSETSKLPAATDPKGSNCVSPSQKTLLGR